MITGTINPCEYCSLISHIVLSCQKSNDQGKRVEKPMINWLRYFKEGELNFLILNPVFSPKNDTK